MKKHPIARAYWHALPYGLAGGLLATMLFWGWSDEIAWSDILAALAGTLVGLALVTLGTWVYIRGRH